MTTVRSLEEERQAILDRMQMRREAYRRMLADGEDFRKVTASRHDGQVETRADLHHERYHAGNGTPHDATVYTYTRAPDSFPRTPLMRVVAEHPVLCALGVAAVLAIGPRRIVRSVASGGAALGAVAGNQSRMDAIGRVLALAGAYAQRKRR